MRRIALFTIALISWSALPLVAQQKAPPKPTPPRTTRPVTTKRPVARPDTTKRPVARPDSTKRATPRPPVRADSTRRPATPTRAAAVRRPPPPPNERTFALTAGAARAGLGFGIGPSLGGVFRYRNGTWPVALRGDAQFGRFSQTPSRGGTQLVGDASLSHLGVGGGIELPLGTPRATAPYLVATAGVYRFAASGPAGDQSDLPDGVFTGTTDLAVGVGAGVRFFKNFFVEGRVVSSGDFTTIPITIGYTLKR
ncbi:MAG: hypothetical protein ABI910_04190 [Gemmatimonadota bacterium]